ncbi:MAG: hypothetical protein IIA66_08505, partial [Planctomycetes bacterium]|nr:hypothetical protein [Planctomycetota bacterium]
MGNPGSIHLRALATGALLSLVCLGCGGEVSDLNIPGAYGSYVADVNEAGHAAGHWLMQNGERRGFILRDGGFIHILQEGVSNIEVTAINDSDRVVGAAAFVNSGLHAFIYDEQSGIRDLGTLGGLRSRALDINGSGQVVGWSEIAITDNEDCCCIPFFIYCGVLHAFLWDDGEMIDLGTFGGQNSRAWKINDFGHAIGYAELAGESEIAHAFLYKNEQMIDLGTLGGATSWPSDINNAGQVVGWSDIVGADGISHAFLYADGEMLDLGTLGGDASWARDINDLGQVVGSAELTDSRVQGFLWEAGVMTGLGTIGSLDSKASHINNAGQILGSFAVEQEDPFTRNNRPCIWEQGMMFDLMAQFPLAAGSRPIWAVLGLNDAGDIPYTTDDSLILFGIPLTDPHIGKPHSYLLHR